MGIGSARGEDRAVAAAEMAISSPLLEASIDGAHGVLLSVSGGSDLGLFEINEAANLVAQAAHDDANIIFGAVIDDALGDEVRVTVIAAGFDSGTPTRREHGALRRSITIPAAAGSGTVEDDIAAGDGEHSHTPDGTGLDRASGMAAYGSDNGSADIPAAPREPRRIVPASDDLDVPDFLK
jgi:cell division protein FtsZ